MVSPDLDTLPLSAVVTVERSINPVDTESVEYRTPDRLGILRPVKADPSIAGNDPVSLEADSPVSVESPCEWLSFPTTVALYVPVTSPENTELVFR